MPGREVTEGARPEQGREERLLRSIIEQMADGIIIVGKDGIIRFANPAAEQLFTRRADELVGADFGFPIANGQPAEIHLVRPHGELVTAELRVVDVVWDGAPARLISLRDISDRRRAEERARQVEQERTARAEAEAANRAKSEFLATMSHELRTPLNAVIGYAQLLDLGIGGPLTQEQRMQLQRIRASSRHLLGLVNEVLDLAKVDAGQLAVHVSPGSAAAVADGAAALLEPSAETRGIRFVVRRADDDTEREVRYVGDEDRVRQIVVNLLTNAVKFTDAGGSVSLVYGRSPRADTAARLRGGGAWAYFTVTDSGIGIPADQLSRIFEPFVQVTSGHTRPNDGSGLGLAISRRLARLMHGDITVRSRFGEGSSFTLWLPAVDSEHQAQSGERSAGAGGAANRGLADVGELLMRNIQPVLEAFVGRVRAESPAAGAATLRFSQLVDHLASYLADLAGLLIALDDADGRPTSVLAGAAEIHRVVAGRHGAQRARLGWTVDAIHREYEILRAEIEVLIQRRGGAIDPSAVDEALSVIHALLRQAQETSIRAFTRAGDTGGAR